MSDNNQKDLIYIWDLAVEKNIPESLINELIDLKILTATPNKRWIYRSSVKTLDRFLQAMEKYSAAQKKIKK